MLSVFEKHFNKIFWLTAFMVFIVVCLRAFFIPFSHDEAATFFFYVQSDNYLPYKAHIYTNNHILNSALTNLFYHAGGSHRFVLRLPNILAFIVLCFGIYRHFRFLKSTGSKLILVTFFILTFNFLDFFELCRGYGLSFSLMLLGLSYLMDYFRDKKITGLLFFTICWQLALAANLILVGVLSILLLFVYFFQFKEKAFFNWKNILIQFFNLVLLGFWIKFSFFYKEQGVLDYGVGESYWKVTFQTLMFIVFGNDYLWLQIAVVIVSVFILSVFISKLFKSGFKAEELFRPELTYPLILFVLVIAYYLQKKILNVNFPEDRTGLFFYLFFVLALVFAMDNMPSPVALLSSGTVFSASVIYFVLSFNLSDFTSWFYHTMPKSLYDTLCSEFSKEGKLFTVGGHRIREMDYAFLNYRGQSVINSMDNSEEMQMNCDYYYSLKSEKPYYQFFYDEIAEDKQWERVLLKRKEKIEHRPVFSSSNKLTVEGSNEFYDFKRFPDTSFVSHNPIEVEVELSFEKVPKPFNAFFVVSLSDEKGKTVYYKRTPLNWLADDLNGKVKYFKLTTGNLPGKVKDFVVHIWNIDKKEIKVTMNNIQIYQLFGKGVDFKIPADYYKMIETITNKPML